MPQRPNQHNEVDPFQLCKGRERREKVAFYQVSMRGKIILGYLVVTVETVRGKTPITG